MLTNFVVLGYFSPETYLPVTSVIATVVGLVMMFGRNTLRVLLGGFRRSPAANEPPRGVKGPHFRSAKKNDGSRAAGR